MAKPLSDADVENLLARLDEQLAELERIPGATAALALQAVQALAEVYGTALGRVLSYASPESVAAFERDELLRHLLALHDLHPDPLVDRVEAALDNVRPYVHSHGGSIRLVDIRDGVATVELGGHCDGCAASAATLEHAVTEAILAMAPELERVNALPPTRPTHPAPVIAADSLLRKPVGTR